MIAPERAADMLRPWLGSAFLSQNADFLSKLSMSLFAYRPERDDPALLSQQTDNLLFMQVREDTKGRMALLMDTGQLIRLRMADFTLMADELMYLVFEGLPKTNANQAMIREYSMRQGSLSALRALYLHYRDLQSAEETATLRRVITSCHEPYRFRHWIDQEV